MKDTPGPTSFSKRNMVVDNHMSALNLFVDGHIIDHIVKCTETEVRLRSDNQEWKTSKEEIYQLIVIMYARGLLAKGQPIEKYGPKLGAQDISRIQCLAIDIKSF